MQIELGAHVRSHDDQDVGRIKYLILDPNTKEIKTVVVEKGFLLADDVEVPVQALEVVDGQHVRLTYTAEQVKQLPRFDESRYTEAPPEQVRLYPWLWPGGLLWPLGTYPATYVTGILPPLLPVATTDGELAIGNSEIARERHPQKDETVITNGSDVISADGEKVGEVHNVIFDTATGKPTTLIISKGFMFTQHVELPATAIASVTDGIVQLNLTKEQIKNAPREPGVAFF